MTGRTLLTWAEIGMAALLWAAIVLGSSVLALTVPVYTSAMTQALDVPRTSGLTAPDVVLLAGDVRELVADQEYDVLPAVWRGGPGFDDAAVSHLLDVRRVFSAARVAVGIIALLLAAYVSWCVALRRLQQLARGMNAGAALLGIVGLVAVAAAFLDFGWLFAQFHGLFFASGTWMFPADSLLIRLFPERFWIASGAAWAVLVALGAAILVGCAFYLKRSLAAANASRTEKSV